MTTADISEKVRRHPIPSISGLLVLICALSFYLRIELITDLEIRLDDVGRQANQIDLNLMAGSNLDEHLTAMKKHVAELDTRLVRASELATNLKYFYGIESRTGVTLIDLKQNAVGVPARGAVKTQLNGVGYTVALVGTFAQDLAYLSELERGAYFYRLKGFSMQRGRDPAQPTVTMSLNLELLGGA